jgi:hemoglobin
MTAPTPYERIGGEAALRHLCRRFYALMDTLPEAAACRAIHPASLESSEQKLFEYLSYWLGGPPIFVQKHGAPMLRRRHLHVPIGAEEIRGWLACFRGAWAETVDDATLEAALLPKVEQLAWHMGNAPIQGAPHG